MSISEAGGRASETGETPEDRSWWRRVGKGVLLNAGLLVFSAGLAVGFAEVAVRLVAPQQLIIKRPDIWVGSDSLGWTNRPNLRTTINTGEGTVHLFTDRRGFRIGDPEYRQRHRRVLLLGDSYMAALQVEHEESAAGFLEDLLSERLAEPVTVWNTGVQGWNPNHYLIQAKELLSAHEFEAIVVAFYLGNDVVERRWDRFPARVPQDLHQFRWPRRLSWPDVVDAWLFPINDFLEVRSHLFIFVRKRLSTFRMKTGLTRVYFPEYFRRDSAGANGWQVTADICRDLAAVGDRHGAPTVFVLIPAPYQVDQEVFYQYVQGIGIDSAATDLDQPNRLLGAALRERGLHVVDLLEEFRAVHDRGDVELYGKVDQHFTAAGHELFARRVEAALAELWAAEGSASPRTSP